MLEFCPYVKSFVTVLTLKKDENFNITINTAKKSTKTLTFKHYVNTIPTLLYIITYKLRYQIDRINLMFL